MTEPSLKIVKTAPARGWTFHERIEAHCQRIWPKVLTDTDHEDSHDLFQDVLQAMKDAENG